MTKHKHQKNQILTQRFQRQLINIQPGFLKHYNLKQRFQLQRIDTQHHQILRKSFHRLMKIHPKFKVSTKIDNLEVLNIHPTAVNPNFIKEEHKYEDALFYVYYPVYTFRISMIVYTNEIIWNWNQNANKNFCCIIVNYRYKNTDALFTNLVLVSRNDYHGQNVSKCPELEAEFPSCYSRLKTAHERIERMMQEEQRRLDEFSQILDSFLGTDGQTTQTVTEWSQSETEVSTSEEQQTSEVSNLDTEVSTPVDQQTSEVSNSEEEFPSIVGNSSEIQSVIYP
eukprot:XP_763826.1 hypothetical protein [Theileria parva strain Muguga]